MGVTVVGMGTMAGRRHLVLPGLIAVIGALEITVSGVRPRWLTLVMFAAACAVLRLSVRAPLAVAPAVGALYAGAGAVGADIVNPAAWIVVLAFACFDAGLRCGPSRVLPCLVSVCVAVAVSYAGLAWFTTFTPNLAFGLVFGLGSWALGTALRAALDRAGRAGAEAEREGIALVMAGERAVSQTRSRLAAEIPDVFAHAVGAMVVQAASARDQVRSSPVLASRTLEDVARSGRNALAQTAVVLHALRPPQPDTTAPPRPVEPSRTLGRWRPYDAAVPAVIGLLVTLEAVMNADRSLVVTVSAAWLAAGVLCLRRRFPLLVAPAVSGVMLAAYWLGVSIDGPATTVVLFALAGLGTGRYLPRERLPSGLAAVLIAAGLMLLPVGVEGDVVLVAAVGLVPWGVGVLVRAALDRAGSSAAAGERARLERAVEQERSAANERARVARGVHDLLADSLHVMVVQATVAAELAASDPGDAVIAVERVQEAGRDALQRLGGLLPLIQDGDARLHPQPGMAALPGLAERFTRAGLEIEIDLAVAEPLPPMVEVSIYHIVSEALTNALKHAPGSGVQVRTAHTRSQVDVEVRNSRPPSRPAPLPGGNGLIGLRERVLAFGGSLDVGATPDGGFQLAASIPIPGPNGDAAS
jgi:signal transduction histidine kinase